MKSIRLFPDDDEGAGIAITILALYGMLFASISQWDVFPFLVALVPFVLTEIGSRYRKRIVWLLIVLDLILTIILLLIWTVIHFEDGTEVAVLAAIIGSAFYLAVITEYFKEKVRVRFGVYI